MRPRTRTRPRTTKRGISWIEGLFASLLVAILILAVWRILDAARSGDRGLGRLLASHPERVSPLADLIAEITEGMVIERPLPGRTRPYLIIRDPVHHLVFYSLQLPPNGGVGSLRRDRIRPSGPDGQVLVEGVEELSFTSLSDGLVMMWVQLVSDEGPLALHTQVRLRNRAAADVDSISAKVLN